MPRLGSTDKHKCLLCQHPFAKRSKLKEHLTQTKKDGNTRCTTGSRGLFKVIPNEVWNEKILPYYKDDRPLPSAWVLISNIFT